MQAQTPEVSSKKATTAATKKTLTLEIVSSAAGPSAYIDDHRIAGTKPYGGGRVTHSFNVNLTDLLRAVPGLTYAIDAQPANGWTNQKPTQPGAYWIRGNLLLTDALVEVKLVDGVLWCNLHQVNTELRFGNGFTVEQLNPDFEWLGPLAPMGGR